MIVVFMGLCGGMGVWVYGLGRGGKGKGMFEEMYFCVEDRKGVGVV